MHKEARTIHTESPAEMFKELVEGALDHQHLETSDESAFYLVNLLAGFVNPVGPRADLGSPPDQALAEILLTAVRSDGHQRFVLFQLTGDLALFLTGFFADSLEGRHVSPAYYQQLGRTAYAQAADCAQPSSAPVFAELADNFAPFTGVLHEVSERCTMLDTSHLMRLYERYEAHGNARDAERLGKHGLSVVPGSGLVH